MADLMGLSLNSLLFSSSPNSSLLTTPSSSLNSIQTGLTPNQGLHKRFDSPPTSVEFVSRIAFSPNKRFPAVKVGGRMQVPDDIVKLHASWTLLRSQNTNMHMINRHLVIRHLCNPPNVILHNLL
ncbi:putative ectonucleotide pyrophosphatase/phosphodiesterase family member 1-like isoform X1 [Capsicum annuum]|nr:putative ectonucleotide pyrophosphatase/phosphodiesterase family member 1-like isoform X1 [Capsicum annuum]